MKDFKRPTTETRGICSWRERLADPLKQWKKDCSAMESAASSLTGLPQPIANLFRNSDFGEPELLICIAEHKVPLLGQGPDSQCDVWALVETQVGKVSLSVEAKAKEAFGTGHESLGKWLKAGKSSNSLKNRQVRCADILAHFPVSSTQYTEVACQLLHRCAAAVIEAERFRIVHAAFLVQAFDSPISSWTEFEKFCSAMGLNNVQNGKLYFVSVGKIQLAVGWADCSLATSSPVTATM